MASLSFSAILLLTLSATTLAVVSPNGDCGPKVGYTCQGSNFGNSCGPNNKCGRDFSYSKLSGGCQPAYGFCYAPKSISPDGTCGNNADQFSCQESSFGNSCGPNNRCGGDAGYSGAGCQPAYGFCQICTVTAIPSTITSRTTTVTLATSATTTTSPTTISSGIIVTMTSTTSTVTSVYTVTPSVTPCNGQVGQTFGGVVSRSCGPPIGFDNPVGNNGGQPVGFNPETRTNDVDNAQLCRQLCQGNRNCNGYLYRTRVGPMSAAIGTVAYCYTRSAPNPVTDSEACPVGTEATRYLDFGSRSPACVNGFNAPAAQQQSVAPSKLKFLKRDPVPVTSVSPSQAYCGTVTTVGYTTTTTRTTSTSVSITQTTSTALSFTTVPSSTQTLVSTEVTTTVTTTTMTP